jgi:phosphohistidine phosphatase
VKSVLILRHAKSSWKDSEIDDHERPLNKRGKRDAPIMGKLLKNKHLVPDLIISSTAKRARSTAKRVAESSGYMGKITLDRSLYAAEPAAYINVLRHLSNEYTQVLMVGHNPGIEELVSMIAGEEHVMPTCSLVHIRFDINSWNEINNKSRGKLLGTWQPRELIEKHDFDG